MAMWRWGRGLRSKGWGGLGQPQRVWRGTLSGSLGRIARVMVLRGLGPEDGNLAFNNPPYILSSDVLGPLLCHHQPLQMAPGVHGLRGGCLQGKAPLGGPTPHICSGG